MTSTDSLPKTHGPGTPQWMQDTTFYLVRVKRFDRHDTLLETQYFSIIEDDKAESYIVSSISDYSI